MKTSILDISVDSKLREQKAAWYKTYNIDINS